MPISEKQLQANRANAQKSTGPKSGQGKEIASQNGVKHGLYAKAIVMLDSPKTGVPQFEFLPSRKSDRSSNKSH